MEDRNPFNGRTPVDDLLDQHDRNPIHVGSLEDGWVRHIAYGADSPWEFDVLLEDVDGIPEVTGLRIVRRGVDRHAMWTYVEPRDAVITLKQLRTIRIGYLRDQARRVLLGDREAVLAGMRNVLGRRTTEALTPEHYEEVAQVYMQAAPLGAPIQAIMRHWGVKRAMASRYVQQARKLGYLGWPSRRGVAGWDGTPGPTKEEGR